MHGRGDRAVSAGQLERLVPGPRIIEQGGDDRPGSPADAAMAPAGRAAIANGSTAHPRPGRAQQTAGAVIAADERARSGSSEECELLT